MFSLAGKISMRSTYARITLTRAGWIFVLLTCAHCFAQGALQVALYLGDSGAFSLLSGIVYEAQVPLDEVAWLQRRDGNLDLQLCSKVPLGPEGAASCTTVFDTAAPGNISNAAVTSRASAPSLRDATPFLLVPRSLETKQIVASVNVTGGIDGVNFTYADDGHENTVFLSEQCARVLVYSGTVMGAYKYEDAALLGAQFWLLAVSFIAILYGSIPQILAVSFTRVVATMWSAYSIWQNKHYETIFYRLMAATGTPCHFDFFPTLFKMRTALSIADFVLNLSALTFTAYLGQSLIKTFSTFTFRRAGPPAEVVRIHRLFLAFFVCLQLSVFFLVTPICLWITWLLQGIIGRMTTRTPLYDGVFIATIATVLPWITMGLFAVRREMKHTMIFFLFICFVYVACWSIMFDSQVYQLTFVQWVFFSSLTVVSFMVLIATAVFGVLCRLNFGKGLAQYLHVEAVLAEADFAPEIFPTDTSTSVSRPSTNGSERGLASANALKRDINWDPFHSETDSPVIVIDLQPEPSHKTY